MQFKTVTILAVCANMLTACSPSPKSVVEDFYQHISDGKIEQAMALIDMKQTASMGLSEGKMRQAMASQSEKLNNIKCGGIKEVNIKNEEVRGDLAIITYEVICKSGLKPTPASKEHLIKVDGKWLITVKF